MWDGPENITCSKWVPSDYAGDDTINWLDRTAMKALTRWDTYWDGWPFTGVLSWYVSHSGQLCLLPLVDRKRVLGKGQWLCCAVGKVIICLWSHWPCITDCVAYPPTYSVALRKEMSISPTVRSMALLPSVLWRCWLGGRKGILPIKNEWWGASMVICLGRGADLHTAQLMPLPLTDSCSSKSRLVLPFWYRLTWVVPDKGPLNGCCCVIVVVRSMAPFTCYCCF